MKKLALVFGVACVLSTTAMAADIAFYVGAPNPDGWYTAAAMNRDVETIISLTGHLFKDVQKFTDSQLAEFGAWADENMNDGELDIIWLNGTMPSVLYQFPNVNPNGSRAELWLDGGNMFINVGDWFAYCSYEGGSRQADNGGTGAANILDLAAGIISGGAQGQMVVTALGQQYLPSLNAVAAERPVSLSAVVAPWEVAAIFGQNAAGTYADPVVIHNTATNGYVAFVNQATTWITDRGLTCAEFIANWVATVIGLGDPAAAADPIPEDGAVDIPRDVVVTWLPGEFAATHDVYFGTSFDDVNDASRGNPMGVLASQGQTAAEFDPAGLVYGQTYYWRVDEVNAAPDNTIFKGETWSFTAEPFSYPVTPIAATASSGQPNMGPQNTINGSGLSANDEHSTELTQMWMSAGAPQPNWIQYEFDKVYKLDQLWVWNSNQLIEPFIGFGARNVTIEYSADGETWTALEGVPEFAQATGSPSYTSNTTVAFGGVEAKFVKLTIDKTWGGVAPQTGLSEVRFFYVPVQARAPQPADDAVDVSIDTALNWRPGREAGSHEVYFGTGENALTLADTVTEPSYTPAAMDFGTTYFWKINEVNATGAYEGEVWSFTTQEFAVIDDMESYNDDDNRIYDTWIDGLTDAAKGGSQVGYDVSPFAEKTIIHGGSQSMPLLYDNSASPFVSEAQRTFATAQDWTTNGAESLVVNFRGNAPAFAETASGNIIMNGIGTDIWNNTDQFRFAYKTLNGNGTMIARVESIVRSDVWAKGGVMIRQSIEPGSTHAFMPMTASGGNGASFQRRLAANGASTNNDSTTVVAAPYWVKIERNGNNFTGSISPDGIAWTPLGTPQTITMTNPVLIGLALCSHSASVVTSAEFSNIGTTGNVTGNWQIAEIGVEQPAGNSAEGLYVSVTDSSGKGKVVQHPDAAATANVSWQQWAIPLSEFTSAGVKMNAVKSMTIGVGNKAAPKTGGTGIVYLDDIGFGRPAQ